MPAEGPTINGIPVAGDMVDGFWVQRIAVTTGQDGAKIDASETSPVPVFGFMRDGGNISATTSGSTWTSFPSQVCKSFELFNDTGTTVLVRQDGGSVTLPLFDNDRLFV